MGGGGGGGGGGGIPSNVATNRRWSTTQVKPAFSLSAGGGAAQKKKGGDSSRGSKTAAHWETATATAAAGLMPHFASFSPPPRDWERHDDGRGALAMAKHPYASASACGGEKSFLSVNEKPDKDMGVAELPTFVSCVVRYPSLSFAVPISPPHTSPRKSEN